MSIALTWLWQGLALAGLTVLLLRLLPHLNAATRHAIWWAALVAVLCVPLVLAAGSVRHVLPGVAAPFAEGGVRQRSCCRLPPTGWACYAHRRGSSRRSVASSAWCHGCSRRAGARAHVNALRHRSRTATAALVETRGRARRSAELRISEGLAGACALGFRRPVIVVGRTLVERLDDAALDQVVMHEYAHWSGTMTGCSCSRPLPARLRGLHPAVWLALPPHRPRSRSGL